jgi:diguanylate cyclase (GGDEF)-like protein/PAS domain S-box-containing protein
MPLEHVGNVPAPGSPTGRKPAKGIRLNMAMAGASRSATLLVLTGMICGALFFVATLLSLFISGEHPTGSPLDDGDVRGWLLAVSAATGFGFALLAYDRHRALLGARRAEQSFRKLYDSVSEGIFRSTLDGRMISANPALVRLNGYDTEEELIRNCNDIAAEWYVDPNRRAEIHEMLLERDQVTNVVSEVYRHKTRERIWIEESVRLVRDRKTGEPLYYEGNVSEVTETIRRLELQGRYEKIASLMSGCLYQLRHGPDGWPSMPYASVGLYHIFGVRPEEVKHDMRVMRRLLHPEDFQRIAATMNHSRRTLTPWQCEYRICLPEGITKWVSANAVPEREADGSTLWHGYVADITERKRSEAKIYELAYFDALTHLPNRASLRERLRRSLAKRKRRQGGALLFVDLDHFKVLNDTKGHHVGDLLLCEIGKRLCACVGPKDMVARIGGDEFVVVLEGPTDEPGEMEQRVRDVGECMLAAIDQPFHIDESIFQSTASIGAVVFTGEDRDVDEVLKQADLAMYEAKSAGRGALRFFEKEMQIAAADRLALTSNLRHATRDGQMLLYYQPLVDATGRCVGAEALLRWNHPTRGLLNAGQFIPLAERSGFMGSIDTWTLGAACAALKEWEHDPQLCDLQLAFNVSAHEMNRVEFGDLVEAALRESGARGDKLVLELTEHVMLDDIETVTKVMHRLQSLGLRFAIDDFGTGYSSLSYLKRLPIDTLKIDKSFVRDIETDQSGREIIQTILNIARSLKISVVAEGVETELQAVLLRQLGCHYFQGYLFAKPMPADEFRAYVDANAAEYAQVPVRTGTLA